MTLSTVDVLSTNTVANTISSALKNTSGNLTIQNNETSSAVQTLSGAITASAAGLTVTNAGGTLDFSGAITTGSTAATGLSATVNGGTLLFNKNATSTTIGYSAFTVNNGGTLASGAKAAIGDSQSNFGPGQITLNNGSTLADNGGAYPVKLNNAIVLGSGASVTFTGDALDLTGAITVNGADTITSNTSAATTLTSFSGTAAVTDTLSLAGTGTLDLGTSSTFTGNSVTLSGSQLNFTAATTITANTAATIDNKLAGAFALTANGSSTLTLAGANTYTKSTTVSGGGTLIISADNNLGTAPTTATVADLVLNGGTLEANGSFALTSDRGIALGPTTGTGSGTIDVTGSNTLTYGGIIANDGTDTGSLIKTDSGKLTLSGANTYAGATTVSSGTLADGLANALPTGTALSVTGTFDLAGFAQKVASVTGSGTVTDSGTAKAFTVANTSPDTFAGALTNNLALTVAGTNILTLSGSFNTYSGATTVSSGTLLVNGSESNSAITVGSGGTLGGTGTIGNNVTVNSSGTLAPGGSGTSIGVLNVGGNVTFQSGSTFQVLVTPVAASNNSPTAGTDYDQLNVTGTGTATINGTVTLAGSTNANVTTPANYTVINSPTNISGYFNGSSGTGGLVLLSGQAFQTDYNPPASSPLGPQHSLTLNETTTPSVVYVDASWAGTATDALPTNDPVDGNAIYGVSAFSDIPSALNGVKNNGIVVIYGGTYSAPVNFNVPLQPIEIAVNNSYSGPTTVDIAGNVTISQNTTFAEESAYADPGSGAANLIFGGTVNDLTAGAHGLTVENLASASTSNTTTTAGVSPVSEVQTYTYRGISLGGTYSLTVDGTYTITGIPYNASLATVASDINAVLGAGAVSVSGAGFVAGDGETVPDTGNYTVTWTGYGPHTLTINQAGLTTTAAATTSRTVPGVTQDEIQEFNYSDPGATSGTFTLSLNSVSSNPINYGDTTPGDIATALAAIPAIGLASNVSVNFVSTTDPYDFTVTFVGALANTPETLMGISTNFSGGSADPGSGTAQEDQVGTSTQEQQTVNVYAAGGTFTLTFNGATTGALAYNVPASGGTGSTASVQNALNALGNISGVTVTGSAGNYTVTFNTPGPQSYLLSVNAGGLTQSPATGSTLETTPGVAPVSAVQQVTESAAISGGTVTGGTFALTFGANTFSGIPYNETAANVQTDLNSLASIISAGGVTVTGGFSSGAGAYTITFNNSGPQNQITINSSALTVNVPETLTFSAAVGGTTPLGSLTVTQPNSPLATSIDTTTVATGSGNQSYSGAVTLGSSTVALIATGGTATFGSTLDAATLNTVQTLTVAGTNTGQSLTLSFNGTASTAPQTISGAASAVTLTNITNLLNGIPAFVGNYTVTGSTGGPFTITFNNSLANTSIPLLTSTFGSNTSTPAIQQAGSGNALQKLVVAGANTGQTLTLTYNGVSGTVVVSGAGTSTTANNVLTALNHIAALNGNVTVYGPTGGPFVIDFHGSLANTTVAALTASFGTNTATPTVISAGGENLSITGSAAFNGAVSSNMPLNSLSVSSAAAINTTNITTIAGQTYTGAVTLGTDTTLTATGGTVAFGSTVNDTTTAGTEGLTITGNATFGGAVGGTKALGSLSVSGTSGINATAINTTSAGSESGNQTYSGAATLGTGAGTTVTLTATGGTVAFGSTLDDMTTAGNQALAITGNATFGGVVGGSKALNSLTVSGSAGINATAISTTGNQSYTGAATLGANTVLTDTGATGITFGSTVDSYNATANSLTLTTTQTGASISLNGTVGGNNSLFDLTIADAGPAGGAGVIAGVSDKSIKNSGGALTLGQTETYSGATNVNAGTLLVDGCDSNSSTITVSPGATLGGIGTVGAPTVADGIVNSGDPVTSAGILNLASANFSSGGNLTINIAGVATAGTNYDQLNLGNAALTLGSTSTLTIDLNGLSANAAGTATNVILGSSITGTFTNVNVVNNPHGFVPLLQYTTNGLNIVLQGKLVFTTSAQTLTAGATSGTITVQLDDANNNPATATSTQTVNLTTSSGVGQFLNAGGTSITSVTIASGSSSASFTYNDTLAGNPVLTAADSGLTSATLAETVTAAAASELVFTTSAQTLTAGVASGTITVQLDDAYNNAATATTTQTVNLTTSSTAGQFLNGGGTSITTVTITSGASSASFTYNDTLAGSPVLTAADSGLTSAKQTETVNAAASELVFTTSAQNLTAGVASGTITVQLDDAYNNAATATTTQTVNLTTSSTAGQFLNGGGTSITSVTIASGATSASFTYTDTLAGNPVLTAADSGLTSATLPETVTVAAASELVFTTSAQTLTAGVASGTITVQLDDAYNNAATATTTQTVNLTTSSTAGQFLNGGGTGITSVTIASGASSASFTYTDTLVGSPVLTAADSGLTSATLAETVTTQTTPNVSVTDNGGTYNGSPFTPTAASVTYGGTTIASLGSGTLSYQYTGTGSTSYSSTTAPTAAGTYTVVATYTSNNPSYTNASSSPAPFTISPEAITITATSQTPTYGFGGTSAALGTTGFSASSGTIYNSDISGVTLSTNDTTSTSGNYLAGTYNLTPSAAAGPGVSNYTISYAPDTGGLVVRQLGLTITGLTANKTYDGSTTTGITIGGSAVLNTPIVSDLVSINASGASAAFTSGNAGTGLTVNFSGYALGGGDAGNYYLSAQPSITTGTINPANANPSVTGYSVVWDGNPHTATASATGVSGPLPISDFNLTGTTHTAVGTYTGDPWSFSDPSGNYLPSSGGTVTDSISAPAAPSGLTYSSNPGVFTLGTAITADTPSGSGGAIVSYGISPNLPAGLSLNTSTGVITGTPTALVTAGSYTVTATNPAGSTTATVAITVFGTNTTTKGSWIGTYGSDGENVVGSSASNYPTYATVSTTGNATWTWAASTTTVSALQQPAPANGRVAAAWYASSFFGINVDLTDGLSHDVSLYVVDYSGGPRSESIAVTNAAGAVLSPAQTVSSFSGGEYLTWNVTGDVEFVITKVSGPNAVVSGTFFGVPTLPEASFVATDTTTKGSWIGTYGSDGENVVGSSAPSYPPYATVSATGNSTWTWAASTTTVSALQQPAPANGRVAAAWYALNSFTINVDLTDGLSHDVSLYVVDYDEQSRSESIAVTNAAGVVLSPAQTVSSFSGGEYLTWNVTGDVNFVITKMAGSNAVVSGIFFGVPTLPEASFVATDTTTKGSWIGTYGPDGENVIGSSGPSYPTYATVSATGNSTWTWAASTTTVSALQQPAPATGRVAAAWYALNSFTINVDLTDGLSHDVSLYVVDYDEQSRSESIEVTNAAGVVLSPPQTVSSFSGGEYLTWNVTGDVNFVITKVAGSNAVVSGIFFGVPTLPEASFVVTDTTTKGSWIGTYGPDGENVIGSSGPSYPTYATVSATGNSTWTWAASTTTVSALQQPAPATGRVAAAWYALNSFTINVDLTDGLSHDVSLYVVDYDEQSRSESIEVTNAAGVVLSPPQTVSSFSGGEYLTWNVLGDVEFVITNVSGPNAVVSGIFFNS